MTNNDAILLELQSLNKRLSGLEQGQAELRQVQGQTNSSVARLTTAVEALAAGQKDQATKADIHRLEQKIDKVAKDVKSDKERIENLEEATNTHNPHKN